MHQTTDSIWIELYDYNRDGVRIIGSKYGQQPELKTYYKDLKLVIVLKFNDQMDKREWQEIFSGILHRVKTRYINGV